MQGQIHQTEQSLLEECLRYFQKLPVYALLFEKMAEKYASLGHLGGSFVLDDLPQEARKQLNGFLCRDYTGCTSVVITYRQLERALQESRFAALSWQKILEAYLGRRLYSNKEQKLQRNNARKTTICWIAQECRNPSVQEWLLDIAEESNLLRSGYRRSPEELRQQIYMIDTAADLLEAQQRCGEKLPAAIFAARATGNPHAFDENTMAYQLLVNFLKWKEPNAGKELVFSEWEYRNRLLYQAGIVKDELSNSVLIYGLKAENQKQKQHTGMLSFAVQREPLYITLHTLARLKTILPNHGNTVYIVENPAVFAFLMHRYPETALVCSNGQLNLAVWILLDLLPETVEIVYAGDFDPEGLLIAQKIKLRYGERLRLWNYTEENYRTYCSAVRLKERRLKQLENIKIPELQAVKESMREKKCAAYQEAMLQEYQIDEDK